MSKDIRRLIEMDYIYRYDSPMQKNSYHSILTFSAEGKTVFIELIPQCSKPWYGREIIYNNEQSFFSEYIDNNYEVYNDTGIDLIRKSLDKLLAELVW